MALSFSGSKASSGRAFDLVELVRGERTIDALAPERDGLADLKKSKHTKARHKRGAASGQCAETTIRGHSGAQLCKNSRKLRRWA